MKTSEKCANGCIPSSPHVGCPVHGPPPPEPTPRSRFTYAKCGVDGCDIPPTVPIGIAGNGCCFCWQHCPGTCYERESETLRARLQAATERAEKAERAFEVLTDANAQVCQERDAERKRADEWRKLQSETLGDLAKAAQKTAQAEATAESLRAALKGVLNAAPSDRQRVWNAARAALAAHSKAVGP